AIPAPCHRSGNRLVLREQFRGAWDRCILSSVMAQLDRPDRAPCRTWGKRPAPPDELPGALDMYKSPQPKQAESKHLRAVLQGEDTCLDHSQIFEGTQRCRNRSAR